MESKDIVKIFEKFESSDTYKKIFINGAWGIGKSYYTNEYVNKNFENIVYISLFGKNTFDVIENYIAKKLINKLNSIQKFKKKSRNFVKKINGSVTLYGISISTPNLNSITLIEEFHTILEKKELIIIIDDLERKSENVFIEDIMGMIEEFSLFKKTKIAIIGDEKNLCKDDLDKWTKFKEKIIEKEYLITKYSDESIKALLTDRIVDHIDKDLLDDFITSFILQHHTKNLRTLNKGVILFLDIMNSYLEGDYNSKIKLSILRCCMAVAIEFNEELYKPNENDKDSDDTYKLLQYQIDLNIEERIISHYLNPFNNKDSSILKYVIQIYNGEETQQFINSFNHILQDYLNSDNGKDIFYLSQDEITKTILNLYNELINNSYIFNSVEKFIDDIYEILRWNKALKMNLNYNVISSKFNEILFENFYDMKKELNQNQIDTYIRMESGYTELNKLIESFNKNVIKKYINDKLDIIEIKYKENNFDIIPVFRINHSKMVLVYHL